MDHNIETARCLHYSTGIPVCLKRGAAVLCSLPEEIISASSLTGNASLAPEAGGEQDGARYISTPVGEQYIIYDLPAEKEGRERARLFLGPVRTGPVPRALLTELARAGSIRISQQSMLQEHLDGLRQITGQSYFYLGRMAELLFTQKKEADTSAVNENVVLIDGSYYEQTRDYRTQQFFHSPYMIEQEISHCISIGDTKGALHILSEINRRPRARLAGSALRSLKNSIICSATFMARAAIAGGVDPDDAFTLSDTYIQRTELCRDVKELQDLERQMVSGYSEAVNGTRSVRYSVQIGSAVNYINTHLCDPLTVPEIAEHVFLSANYLSGLFKKEMGITIHEYMIRRRIEESCYFVRRGREKIADIAAFYQFSSQSHFVKCFHQIMGVTPGEYRRTNGDQPAAAKSFPKTDRKPIGRG